MAIAENNFVAITNITPDQDAVVGEIFIAAPPDRVFQALTDPHQLLQWWGQRDTYRTKRWDIDLHPGGKWTASGVGADGKEFAVHGEYIELDPPRLIVYTWNATWTGDLKTTVRWELAPSAGGTLVKIRHSGFATMPEQAKNHSQGWTRVIAWMKAFVEKGETIDTRGHS
jgi:uncharacterized protein YndB with AHSA1/START domain